MPDVCWEPDLGPVQEQLSHGFSRLSAYIFQLYSFPSMLADLSGYLVYPISSQIFSWSVPCLFTNLTMSFIRNFIEILGFGEPTLQLYLSMEYGFLVLYLKKKKFA